MQNTFYLCFQYDLMILKNKKICKIKLTEIQTAISLVANSCQRSFSHEQTDVPIWYLKEKKEYCTGRTRKKRSNQK